MVARFWLVISLLVISASTAVAQSKTALQLCAARDVEVVILIEDHGDAADIAPERLAKAGLDQMQTRLTCTAGRTEEAVAIYDGIISSLGPMLSHPRSAGNATLLARESAFRYMMRARR